MNYISYHWLNWQRNAACAKSREPALTRFLQAELPDRSLDWHKVKFIAIDLETTGLNPMAHEIASIGWVAIENGAIRLQSARHRLVKTRLGVGNSATIHNITDSQAAGGLTLQEALDELLLACAGRVPIFHNASLDMGFINNACLRYFDSQFITPFVDTLQLEKEKLLARSTTIGPASLRLHACRARYGLPESRAHNALDDALATAELFLAWASHRGGAESFAWSEAI